MLERLIFYYVVFLQKYSNKRINIFYMFRAIGFVIILYAISQLMTEPFQAFSDATTATFKTIEFAAVVSKEQLVTLHH